MSASEMSSIPLFEGGQAEPGREQGFGALVVPGPDGQRRALPLRALDVQARVEGLFAQTRVRTRFVNAFEATLRATYIFPLPWQGAVRRFEMRSEGRVVLGRVFERGEAIERHERAIEAGHTSGLFEQEASETFTIELGNIPPRAELEVLVELAAPLEVAEGRASYRFPLVCSEKYIPGAPLPGDPVGAGTAPDTERVPGGSRLNPPRLLPGMPNPIALTLGVTFAAGSFARGESLAASLPLHQSGGGDGEELALTLGNPAQDPDRDLIVRFALPNARVVEGDLMVEPGPRGRFVATLFAPPTSESAPPRDVVVLVDRSGSMGGWNIATARRVTRALLEGLRAEDRVALLAFDHELESPEGGDALAPATSARRAQLDAFTARLDARGGTELRGAIERGLAILAASGAASEEERGRDAALLLVTDAWYGEERALAGLFSAHPRRPALFALGVGATIEGGVLGRMARESGGAVEQIETPADEERALALVRRLLARAAFRELALERADGRPLPEGTLVPAAPPALLPGVPLHLVGELGAGERLGLVLRARTPAGRPLALSLAPRPAEGELVAALWAKRTIDELEARYDAAGYGRRSGPAPTREELAERLVALSCEENVLSRLTAFLAVDEGSEVPRAKLVELVQPVAEPVIRQSVLKFVCREVVRAADQPPAFHDYPQRGDAAGDALEDDALESACVEDELLRALGELRRHLERERSRLGRAPGGPFGAALERLLRLLDELGVVDPRREGEAPSRVRLEELERQALEAIDAFAAEPASRAEPWLALRRALGTWADARRRRSPLLRRRSFFR